jgi:hypothetical protein
MFLKQYLVRYLFLIIIMSGFTAVSGQELFVPLRYNRVLVNASNGPKIIARRAITDTFSITANRPFFDDFSQTSPYPKESLWLDRNVYINSTFAHHPPSYGVATFDGLNEFGYPYKPGFYDESLPCDTLTSIPINLKFINPQDSLYLSFYYQPQGYGEITESFDSLVLEFKPDSFYMGTYWSKDTWVRVWSSPGSKMKAFRWVNIWINPYKYNDTLYKIAHFYHGGFQFRFINYGNLSGNLDIWNLDYVYLNKNRNRHDSIYNDIAIMRRPESLLKDYVSVPASHLKADTSLLRDDQLMYTQNLNNKPINVRGLFMIKDETNPVPLLYNANSSNNNNARSILKLTVYDSIGLQFPFYKLNNDTIHLESTLMSYYLQDEHRENDSVTRTHEFTNYYAYDDGSAEEGYGIDLGAYKTGRVSYRFKMAANVSKSDSLRAISMFFNYSKDDNRGRAFKLMVWKDFTSNPLRQLDVITPDFRDSVYNGFYTYEFKRPLCIDSLVDNKGYFYIGWEQNINYMLNIGLDKNYFELSRDSLPLKSDSNIHYYTNNKWRTSVAQGALMMRPVISRYKLVGINDHNKSEHLSTKIYPNPARNQIMVFTGTPEMVVLTLSDLQGRELKRMNVFNSAVLQLEGMKPGLYIVVLTDTNSHLKYYHKLIIQN